MDRGWAQSAAQLPAGAFFSTHPEDAVSFLKVGRMKCKRNRYRDRHRDQTFLAQSLATGSSIPVAISGTVISLQNGGANEVGLSLCLPQ
jgi:hypothetical protein